jgi:hypothetical protein
LILPRCRGLSRVLHISGVSPFKPTWRGELISQPLNQMKYVIQKKTKRTFGHFLYTFLLENRQHFHYFHQSIDVIAFVGNYQVHLTIYKWKIFYFLGENSFDYSQVELYLINFNSNPKRLQLVYLYSWFIQIPSDSVEYLGNCSWFILAIMKAP